tara:strand:+ start:204 stop:698 length:495 start_codon:yes stop_codon:yes gene_type:complete
MKEIFKDVKGYEGIYQVSNLGNVKSLKFGKERILKAGVDSNGYLRVSLFKYNTPRTSKVHKLVAMAFLNHIPDNLNVVIDHIDYNKANNRLDNLQLIKQRENIVRSINKNKTSSQYVGVSWAKHINKWKSQIRINKKNINLGSFNSELDASRAYQKALMEVNNC